MKTKTRPGLTIEARENQLINLAVDCAEERIRSGKASDTLLVHWLKLGTTKAEIEKEKLRNENELLLAKTSAVKQSEQSERKYQEVLDAFRSYSIDED